MLCYPRRLIQPNLGGCDSVLSCLLVHGWSSSFPHQTVSDVTVLYLARYEYLWEDGAKFKRPTKLPAPEYVDALMNWAQSILDDEAVFPNQIGNLTFFVQGLGSDSIVLLERCTVPKKFQGHSADDLSSYVPRLWPHLQQPF